MKNLELLPLPAESKKRIDEFARQYQRMGHISIEVVSYNEGRLIVRAEQKDLVNDKFLSKKELTERIRVCLRERSRTTGSSLCQP